MPYLREIEIIAVVAIITAITRAFPFVAFGRRAKPSAFVTFLGKFLPCAVMAVLVIYCLRNTSFTSLSGFLPQLIAVAVTAGLHIWFRNNLISIGTGTIIYMVLMRIIII